MVMIINFRKLLSLRIRESVLHVSQSKSAASRDWVVRKCEVTLPFKRSFINYGNTTKGHILLRCTLDILLGLKSKVNKLYKI